MIRAVGYRRRPPPPAPWREAARPASEGAADVSTSKAIGVIPASPDTDTSPVLGPRRRPRAPMRAKPQCVDSRGRGCARPASEGAADVSTSKAIGMTGKSRQQVTQHGDQGEVGGRHRIVIKAVRQDPSQSLPFPANDDSLPNSADIEWHQ